MVKGVCVAKGACMAKGGGGRRAWQRGACMAKGEACVTKGGMHGKGGHVCDMTRYDQ